MCALDRLDQKTVARLTRNDSGPDFPPFSNPSRESSRSPPKAELVWHAKQLRANIGRTCISKESAFADFAGGAGLVWATTLNAILPNSPSGLPSPFRPARNIVDSLSQLAFVVALI